MGLMPAYMEQEGILSTKMLCFYKREAGSSLPSTQSTVILMDPEYGNVKAVSKAQITTSQQLLNLQDSDRRTKVFHLTHHVPTHIE